MYYAEHARAVALQSADEKTSNILSAATIESYMQYDRFLALYLVTYSAEFICLCASKVLVRHTRQCSLTQRFPRVLIKCHP